MNKSNLQYFVYVEDSNRREIKKYNVLNATIITEIETKLKNLKGLLVSKAEFEKVVDSVLLYYYWCKSEWEVIITDWPPHIEVKELDRLVDDVKTHRETYNTLPYAVTPNLRTAEKVSVYDQIKLNWDIFINYLWEGLNLDA